MEVSEFDFRLSIADFRLLVQLREEASHGSIENQRSRIENAQTLRCLVVASSVPSGKGTTS
jgi:hypothetical protein